MNDAAGVGQVAGPLPMDCRVTLLAVRRECRLEVVEREFKGGKRCGPSAGMVAR